MGANREHQAQPPLHTVLLASALSPKGKMSRTCPPWKSATICIRAPSGKKSYSQLDSWTGWASWGYILLLCPFSINGTTMNSPDHTPMGQHPHPSSPHCCNSLPPGPQP